MLLRPGTSVDDVARLAVNSMNKHGFCVIDSLFHRKEVRHALKDIETCLASDTFEYGRLAGGRTSSERDKQNINANIRCDKIMWLEGTEHDVPGITNIVARMDEILTEFNTYLENKYFINGRTKVIGLLICFQ